MDVNGKNHNIYKNNIIIKNINYKLLRIYEDNCVDNLYHVNFMDVFNLETLFLLNFIYYLIILMIST